ncbi:MAG: S8 family serine peptidase [Haliscomenobacter sp.]|nr:S8 family serine peptidase [Haliscomenobacter sp.]
MTFWFAHLNPNKIPFYWTLFLLLWGSALPAQIHETETDYISRFGLSAHQTTPGNLGRSNRSSAPEYRFYLAQRKEKGIQPDGYWTIVRELDSLFCILSLNNPEAFLQKAEEHFALIVPANDQWKLAPGWEQRAGRQQREPVQVIVQTNNPEALKADLERSNLTQTIIAEYPEFQSMLFRISDREMKRFLLPSPWVSFIDVRPFVPAAELAVPNHDLSANQVNFVHRQYPGLTGRGLTVSLKEYRPDSTDIDFSDRYLPSGISTAATATHATTMATIIAGAGNSFYTGKGAAPGASISSASFFNLMPEPDTYYKQSSITVQNHSYGLGIENYYGAEARAYDDLVRRYPTLLHVFSSGNIGAGASPSGPYAGVPGFANLTGTFKMAKNLLTVGAVDSFYRVEPLSSRGPAFDGRVKPELVAFGQDGSSGAAALTSGVALLIQQAYQKLHNDSLPPVALVRAMLMNSARDLGPEGPDYSSGYGSVQAAKALELLHKQPFIQDQIQPNEKECQIQIPPGAAHFRATLALDRPAGPGQFPKGPGQRSRRVPRPGGFRLASLGPQRVPSSGFPGCSGQKRHRQPK